MVQLEEPVEIRGFLPNPHLCPAAAYALLVLFPYGEEICAAHMSNLGTITRNPNMTLESTIKAAQAYIHPSKIDCVIYHHPCHDGSGAALAAWAARGDSITYLPLNYLKPFTEEQLRNKNVILIDVSFKREQLQRVRALAKKVMVLDHHDSAEKELAGEEGCFFYMHNSGAILSWHYFHGLDTPAPMFLQLIEDRDLWRWQMRELSEPLYYGLAKRHAEPDYTQYIPYLQAVALDDLIAYGRQLTASNQQWCAETALAAKLCLFKVPGTTQVYNIVGLEVKDNKLISELGDYLCHQHAVDFAMLWYPVPDDNSKFKISFRNNKTNINVGDIAMLLGGGGHPRAAGAVVSESPWRLLEQSE